MPDSIAATLSIHRLLEAMGRLQASDLHIKVGVPPTYRVNGILRPIQSEPLTENEADHILDPIVPEKLKDRFDNEGGIDFATFVKEDRFRVNMYRSGGHTNAAIRRVKSEIPTFESLHLPGIYQRCTAKCGNLPQMLFCGWMHVQINSCCFEYRMLANRPVTPP